MAPAGEYKVQEAPTARAKCQGCKQAIAKGALRLGVLIKHPDFPDWWKWRHWECVTARVVTNMEAASNLQGLEELTQEYQNVVHATFGHPPAPKPRKETTKKGDGKAAVAAAAGGSKGKGKGKRGTGQLGDTVDAEVPLPPPVQQPQPDPLEYLREDLGTMLTLMMGGELPKPFIAFFDPSGASTGRLSVLISQLQATGVLCTPWPTPAHEEQMRAKYEAAAAAEAAAQEAAAAAAAAPAPKKRAAKKKRSRRPRGYDSDEDWP
ncbi:hypothetical protein COHA_005363 [Chlorella ohadii]|uniref:PARP-type domain-containing protein n=1 Tax=Chlorella ohadii TaxID=2649997 RepID=A0AAD5DMV0_9CHLO|nr:hypothetical protein COHA_005363 [Chlorella ohadii]